MANHSKLTPLGSFRATLSLEDASTDTTVDVFREIDDALLSWYDTQALRIIPRDYPKQINVVCHVSAVVSPSDKQMEHDCQ